MEKAYKNISYLFGAVLLLILIGFFKTYFGLFPQFEGLPLLAHFHAIMILSWFGLLIAQPLLIRYKRPDLHRLLGKASYVIVPLMAISMILMMRMSQLKTKNVFIFFIGSADLLFFLTFYALAIYYRHKLTYHTRFIVMTVLPFINPAMGRLGFPGPVIGLLIIGGMLIFERFNKKVYKPYLIALPVFLSLYLSVILFSTSKPFDAVWNMIFAH